MGAVLIVVNASTSAVSDSSVFHDTSPGFVPFFSLKMCCLVDLTT